MIVIKFEKIILYMSHPMWPIEEKASSGRISVCIIPPIPPIIALRAASVGNMKKL